MELNDDPSGQKFMAQGMGTVPYYAIIDSGLTYSGVNPATGWTGERCVLLAAGRQEIASSPVRNEENTGKMVVEWDFIVI